MDGVYSHEYGLDVQLRDPCDGESARDYLVDMMRNIDVLGTASRTAELAPGWLIDDTYAIAGSDDFSSVAFRERPDEGVVMTFERPVSQHRQMRRSLPGPGLCEPRRREQFEVHLDNPGMNSFDSSVEQQILRAGSGFLGSYKEALIRLGSLEDNQNTYDTHKNYEQFTHNELDEADSERILARIGSDVRWPANTLREEVQDTLRGADFRPTSIVSIGANVDICLSDLFALSTDRLAAIVYVVTDDRVAPWVYYQSGTSASWRIAAAVQHHNDEDDIWFTKYGSENKLDAPVALQHALNTKFKAGETESSGDDKLKRLIELGLIPSGSTGVRLFDAITLQQSGHRDFAHIGDIGELIAGATNDNPRFDITPTRHYKSGAKGMVVDIVEASPPARYLTAGILRPTAFWFASAEPLGSDIVAAGINQDFFETESGFTPPVEYIQIARQDGLPILEEQDDYAIVDLANIER